MDDTIRLVFSLFVTGMAGLVIMFIAREVNSKAYCICGHEFNEHYVYPRGMVNPYGSEKCMKCKCKSYRDNLKDERNR